MDHGDESLADVEPMVRRAKMGAEVAGRLRDMVFAGSLKPGQRLPLHELAAVLGVSTTPIREALLTLEKDGLVDSEHHRGFRVAGFSQRDILDVYATHAFVAETLIRRSTSELSSKALADLADIDRSIRDAVEHQQADEVEQLNYRFHRLINTAAPDSTRLRAFLRETTRFVPRRVYKKVPGWLDASAQDHGGILDALGRRDADAAARSTGEHVRHAGELLVEYLQSVGIWE